MTDLKPCPFCGSTPVLKNDIVTNVWWVECANDRCRVQPMTMGHIWKSVVIRDWNRRVDA